MKVKKMMTNKNKPLKNSDQDRENKLLREILQKAVNKEKAPESLRERIAKMIRQ